MYVNFKIILSVSTAKSGWGFDWDCIEFIYVFGGRIDI